MFTSTFGSPKASPISSLIFGITEPKNNFVMFGNLQSQKRSHESPMDWEWQTQGPTDPKSPFPQFKPQQGHKGKLKLVTYFE
jgi:hypothetical protein